MISITKTTVSIRQICSETQKVITRVKMNTNLTGILIQDRMSYTPLYFIQ